MFRRTYEDALRLRETLSYLLFVCSFGTLYRFQTKTEKPIRKLNFISRISNRISLKVPLVTLYEMDLS